MKTSKQIQAEVSGITPPMRRWGSGKKKRKQPGFARFLRGSMMKLARDMADGVISLYGNWQRKSKHRVIRIKRKK